MIILRVYNNPEYIKEIEWVKKETILAYLKDQEVYAKITASDDELRQAYIRSKTKVCCSPFICVHRKRS